MKNILINSLILLISICLSFWVAEVVCRKAKLSKTWSSYIDRKSITTNLKKFNNSNIGYTRIPNYTTKTARDVIFITNNLGFRDINRDEKSKNKKIAVIGDSVLEGFGVEVDDRVSNKIETSLLAKNLNYDLLNFSIAGYATIDQVQILERYVLDYSPESIILQICYNDFQRNLIESLPKSEELSFKKVLQTNSAFYLFISEQYSYFKLKNGKHNQIPNVKPVSQDEWKWTKFYLNKMKNLCETHNIEFIVSYVPLASEVIISQDEIGKKVNNDLGNYCTKDSIVFLSVINQFRDYYNPDYLYLDDCHLSVKGNELLSKIIVEHLTSKK